MSRNPAVIPRRLTVGINVDSYDELTKAGRQLARFIREIDHEHGTFNIDISVSVGGYMNPPEQSEIVFTSDDDFNEEEGEEGTEV